MTAQAFESIYFRGEFHYMASLPLDQYLSTRREIHFISPATNCWRGYIGQWSIKDDKLYLTRLEAFIEDYRRVGMDYLFPGQKEVFASWFSGEIRLPHGEMLHDIHMGYETLYEQDLILEFKEGVLCSERVVDNRSMSQ